MWADFLQETFDHSIKVPIDKSKGGWWADNLLRHHPWLGQTLEVSTATISPLVRRLSSLYASQQDALCDDIRCLSYA